MVEVPICNVLFSLRWETNIKNFFCDVFVWKWGPRPRISSRCYHSNKSAATFKKGTFVHPPWVPNCMQNLKGGWKFSFPKMFDSHKLIFNASEYSYIAYICEPVQYTVIKAILFSSSPLKGALRIKYVKFSTSSNKWLWAANNQPIMPNYRVKI